MTHLHENEQRCEEQQGAPFDARHEAVEILAVGQYQK